MPQTKRYRKKTYTRKRRNKNYAYSNSLIARSPAPTTFVTRLVYEDYIGFIIGSGTIGTEIVRANDCYDPRVAVGGHQPRGFDEFMALYDHFVVLGSKIKATAHNIGSGAAQFGICLRDTSSPASAYNDYAESGKTIVTTLGLSSGIGTKALTMKASVKKELGRKSVMSDPELKGSSGASPVEQIYYHLFASGLNLADGASLNVRYRVEYIVAFIEPKTPVQS